MKRVVLLTLVFVTAVLTGLVVIFIKHCKDKEKEITPEVELIEVELPEDIVFFKCKTIKEYREEVNRRIESKQYFLSLEEIAFLEAKGLYVHGKYISSYNQLYNEITNYYYPIIVSEGEETYLWYVSEGGVIYSEVFKEPYFGDCFENLENKGKAHDNFGNSKIILSESYENSLVYDKNNGRIQEWKLGALTNNYNVPKGSKYLGKTPSETYLFSKDTEVYAVWSDYVVLIADNVKDVKISKEHYDEKEFTILIVNDNSSLKIFKGLSIEGNIPRPLFEEIK